jgi:hypothetical protein
MGQQLFKERAHARHPRRSADEHQAVYIAGRDAGVVQRLFHRSATAIEHWSHQAFELRA